MSLKDKLAVVTGAASGIGAATAKELAEAGATVIVADVQKDKGEAQAAALRDAGGKAKYLYVDVTDAKSIAVFADAVQTQFGTPDVLVNGAGWGTTHPFWEGTPELWDKIISLNFVGPMRLTKAFLPAMIQRASGKIVNIASDAGRVGSLGETVYSGSKGGLIAFTKTIARETARHRINVNCVCPGPSDTPLFQNEFAAASPKLAESLKRVIPWGRLGVPEDIAPAVVFLASDEAGFITGQTLSVSGGLTMV